MLFWGDRRRVWLTARLCFCFEHVVPVVGGRAKALDGGVQGDHGIGHLVASGIGIKATIDLSGLSQQGFEPSWVGPGAGGGEATGLGMEGKATEGINGGFTKDDWLAANPVAGRGSAGTAKQPRSFCDPGAKPCHGRAVVPRSSAPTGSLSFPRSRKTALALVSAYRVPEWMSGSSSTGAILR